MLHKMLIVGVFLLACLVGWIILDFVQMMILITYYTSKLLAVLLLAGFATWLYSLYRRRNK